MTSQPVCKVLREASSDSCRHPPAHKYRTGGITEDAVGAKSARPWPQGRSLSVSRGCYFIHGIFLTHPKAHKIAGGVFPTLPSFRNMKPGSGTCGPGPDHKPTHHPAPRDKAR